MRFRLFFQFRKPRIRARSGIRTTTNLHDEGLEGLLDGAGLDLEVLGVEEDGGAVAAAAAPAVGDVGDAGRPVHALHRARPSRPEG